jgi:biopolymer transport protein TolR
MAIIVNGGGRRRPGSYRPMSDINVTPMVDVMLVLLVVFMVTAPLLTVGVPVDLPKTQATQMVGQDEPLVITLNAEGKLFIQETAVDIESLVPLLRAITANKAETRIFVRGDRMIPYGRVMEVMGTVNQAGFNRVALITESPSAGGTPSRRNEPQRRQR